MSALLAHDLRADQPEDSEGSWSDDTEDFVCQIEDSGDSTQPGSEEAGSQFESWDGQGSFSEEELCLGVESGDSSSPSGAAPGGSASSGRARNRGAPSGGATGGGAPGRGAPISGELWRGPRGGFPDAEDFLECTTKMLRNIPNKYTHEMLIERLNINFRGQFDFIYLPIDFQSECNIGYGFINFRTLQAAQHFEKIYQGVEGKIAFPDANSHKVVQVSPARVQGYEANVERLKYSPVMKELINHPQWMPVLFDEQGNAREFPAPKEGFEGLQASTREELSRKRPGRSAKR